MELDEKQDKIDNDIFQQGFIIQQPLNDEKIKDILVTISKIAKDDTVLKAKTIEKSKAVKGLLDKFDASKAKPADIKKLKEIFYDDYDQDREDFLYDGYLKELTEEYSKKGVKRAKKDIIKEARAKATSKVLNDERKNVIRVLKNVELKKQVEDVKNTIKVQVVNHKNSGPNSINDHINEVNLENVEEIQKIAKEITWDTSLAEDNYYESRKGEFDDRRNKIISDIRKKKQDKFLKAFSICENLNSCAANLKIAADNMNKKFSDPSYLKSKDSSRAAWNDLAQRDLSDLESALKNYVSACATAADDKGNCDNMGAYIQTAAFGIAALKRINNLEKTVNSLVLTVNALIQQLQMNASLSQADVAKVSKKLAQSNDKNFIPYDKWYQMTEFERFSKSFRFKDFCQNPPRAWWNKFSDAEKKRFAAEKVKWMDRRLVELAELFTKDEDKAARYIDSFFFYHNRDKFGFEIDFSEEIQKALKLDDSSQLIFDDLKERLSTLEEKRLIFNKVLYKNNIVRTKGISSNTKVANLIKSKNLAENGVSNSGNNYYANIWRRRGPSPYRKPFNKRESAFLSNKRQGGPMEWANNYFKNPEKAIPNFNSKNFQ